MEEIILYIDLVSQPGRAVLAFLEICKIKYRKVEVRLFKGEYLTDDFKQISPAQTIPTLVHGDLVLYESHAILAYIARTVQAPDHWYPQDPIQKSLVDCYLHWHHHHIRLGCSMFLQSKYMFPLIYGKPFPDFEKFTIEARDDAFEMISNIFNDGLFVARTEKVSIADLACYFEVVTMKWLGFDFGKFPKICEWMKKIAEIEEVKELDRRLFRMTPIFKL